jgi:putative transposase
MDGGWYYLSTILDDYSRCIVTWKLCANMKAEDVTNTLDKSLAKTNISNSNPSKLLSDNGSCYLSNELADCMQDKNMKHLRGRTLLPKTQGKIERYQKSMKNVVKLDNYFSPEQLEQKLEEFVPFWLKS